MDVNEYQRLAQLTVAPGSDLRTAALGLAGESGEFADLVKKAFYQGHNVDYKALEKELGDILWYAALACTILLVPMGDVMEANIAKLRARYPDGFDSQRSQERSAE